MPLRLDELSKRFRGGPVALDHLSLDVPDHALVVILGPSGAGKSTLLRAIAGLTPLDGGTVHVGDENWSELPAEARPVALLPQEPALLPHLDVRHNLSFGLRIRGLDRRAARREAESIAQRLQIDSLLDRRPANLSGGEKQRVMLGRTLLKRPRLLLLDEPLANVDSLTRKLLRSELRRVHDELRAITLYVTHDPCDAALLSTHIAILEAGRFTQQGPWDSVVRSPSTLFGANAAGPSAWQLLDVSVAHNSDGRTSVHLGGAEVLRLPAASSTPADTHRADWTLAVRSLTLSDAEAEAEGPGLIGVLESRAGESPHHGARVRLEDGQRLVADAGGSGASPGDRVGVPIDAEHFVLYDPTGARWPALDPRQPTGPQP